MNFFVLLILASILSPAEFGLIALVIAILAVLQAGLDLGLGGALIQRKELGNSESDTVFWTNLFFGVTVGAALAVFSGPLASLLGNESAAPVIRTISIVIPLICIATVPNALLSRELRFSTLARRDVLGQLLFTVVAIVLALLGFGVWSFVVAVLAQRVLRTAVAWGGVSWRPGVRFSFATLGSLAAFGVAQLLTLLTLQAMLNADRFLIGRCFSAHVLGLYSIAYTLAAFPIQRIVGVIRVVAFSGFSRLQNESAGLRAGYLSALRHILMIAVPISLATFYAAPCLGAIYGDQWRAAILPLRIISAAAVLIGVEVADSILLSAGRPFWRWGVYLLRLSTFLAVAFSVGLSHGMVGISVSLVASMIVGSAATIFLANKITACRLRDVVKHTARPLAASVPAILVASTLENWLPTGEVINALIAAAAALSFYGLCMYRDIGRVFNRIRRAIASNSKRTFEIPLPAKNS